MGAAPIWDGQPAVVSPLRNPRPYTEITEIVPARTPKPGPRRYFTRVPTHAIGVASERRRYPRAALSLPLRLVRVEGAMDFHPVLLVTRNISSRVSSSSLHAKFTSARPSNLKSPWSR